jgi:hypothetical protein
LGRNKIPEQVISEKKIKLILKMNLHFLSKQHCWQGVGFASSAC